MNEQSPIAPRAETLETLQSLLGDRATTAMAVREHHGRDVAHDEVFPPEMVVFPKSTEEVAEIVRLCAATKTPVIPFGAGTSLEGHFTALHGGVCLDLSQMDQIVEVNGEDLDCRVQAGVTREGLNDDLRATGLFFPIDPGANATIGGMASTRASGTNAVRYGTMKENVLGLTVVTPDGSIVRTGGRARKSAAGYDLTRLYVGSEGTLGVITEVQLRLYGRPEAISSAVCSFDTLENAINAVIMLIQVGVPVARVELLDTLQMEAVNAYSKLDNRVAPTLFFEFHGTENSVAEQAQQVEDLTAEFGAENYRWTASAEERNRLWRARHDAYWAAKALKPGADCWSTDACVPISRLSDCILETRADVASERLTAPILGHVGDGNFHLFLLVDRSDASEVARAKGVVDRLARRAIEMGGTCTGEHGIGSGKIEFLTAEHGESVHLMERLKQTLDPDGIMNPGKIFASGSLPAD